MAELDVTQPFTTQRALAAGLTRSVLASSRYRQIVRGIHVSAAVTDVHAEARAALMVASVRSALVSHHLAARLYGAVVPDTPYLHVSVPPGAKRRRRDGVVVHHSARAAVRFRQLPVTSPEDTFLDLAAHLHLVDLVVLGDSLVRKGRTTGDRLTGAAGAATGRGVRLARRAAALVRPRVDSPMETRCRMLRVLSGLPELETDIRFHDEHGNLRRRLDAGDRRTRTAVEYDGRHHVERERQWEADLGRREELEDDEWRVVTLVSKDVYRTPGDTVARLERIFRRRGIRVGRRSQEWRRYFPQR
ncbi:hypothetical protein [Ornithinimicrobium pekingense]|uniref:DUF559 domain-containing protein n=1 Tax=Ornithinimicrobium pekingense TaxID=384677 RepID=A0ABQ2F529_9MICO|nr:hypothetical protein [Ornithinimicrobium pekingense]GGK61720.1 hypothetical protein GCM10011509_07690 [Ornithinimicrobium pekingense]